MKKTLRGDQVKGNLTYLVYLQCTFPTVVTVDRYNVTTFLKVVSDKYTHGEWSWSVYGVHSRFEEHQVTVLRGVVFDKRKYTRTIHKLYTNYTQTIHELYTNYT